MAPEPQTPDSFLVGDEIISINLNSFQVEFEFSRDILKIGGKFTLCREGNNDELFYPSKRTGALNALWILVGCSVTSIRWEMGVCVGKEIDILFDDNTLLRILPSENFRGTILGKNPPPGVYIIEDF